MKKKLRDECVFTKVTPTRTEGKWQVGNRRVQNRGVHGLLARELLFKRPEQSDLFLEPIGGGSVWMTVHVQFFYWTWTKPNTEKKAHDWIYIFICMCLYFSPTCTPSFCSSSKKKVVLFYCGYTIKTVTFWTFSVPVFYKHTDHMLSWSVTVYSATVTQHPPLQRLTILL